MDAYGWTVADLVGREADADEFDAPTENLNNPLPMLYQAGYLTIKGHEKGSDSYLLDIPNREVARGLSGGIVSHISSRAFSDTKAFQRRFYRLISSGDLDGALQELRSYLAAIPYDLAARDEKGFQSALYLIFNLTDIRMETEVRLATGRIDAVVRIPNPRQDDTTYVLEFKYGKPAADALAQIDEKGYLVPFEQCDGRLYKVGISFSPTERTISDWIIEEA